VVPRLALSLLLSSRYTFYDDGLDVEGVRSPRRPREENRGGDGQ